SLLPRHPRRARDRSPMSASRPCYKARPERLAPASACETTDERRRGGHAEHDGADEHEEIESEIRRGADEHAAQSVDLVAERVASGEHTEPARHDRDRVERTRGEEERHRD